MPRLLEYSTLYFGAKEVMSFLGRNLVGQYRGEVVTDHAENDLPGKRVPGCRVKHRAKFNWIKMYDKGSVLRVETERGARLRDAKKWRRKDLRSWSSSARAADSFESPSIAIPVAPGILRAWRSGGG
jgi:hypothetical protein